jgi:hypothetical protein
LTLWLKISSRKRSKNGGDSGTCVDMRGGELLRGWWRPLGRMVIFMIFTASVQNILDTPSWRLRLWFSGVCHIIVWHIGADVSETPLASFFLHHNYDSKSLCSNICAYLAGYNDS